MSYAALGLDMSTVTAIGKVATDPAIPAVTCEVLRLNRATEGKPVGAACPPYRPTPAQKATGIGLYRAILPLRVATWTRQHPLLGIGVAAGAAAFLIAFGYSLRSR